MPPRRRKAFFVPGEPAPDRLLEHDGQHAESPERVSPSQLGAQSPSAVPDTSRPRIRTYARRSKTHPRRRATDRSAGSAVDIRVEGSHQVLVLPCAGGVGGTTLCALLGTELALARSGRVAAVDIHPHGGSLGVRFPHRTDASLRSLAEAVVEHGRLTAVQVDGFLQDTTSRLGVLTSPRSPQVTESLSTTELRRVTELLQEYHQFLILDGCSDLTHALTRAALCMASHLVLVVGTGVDGAVAATDTVKWLRHNGFEELLSRSAAVVVRRSASRGARLPELREYLDSFCASTALLPYDAHLAQGGVLDPRLVSASLRKTMSPILANVVHGIACASVSTD